MKTTNYDNADFRLLNHGSVIALRPLNEDAREWLEATCETEAWQWMGPCLVVDWRFADAIAAAMDRDGYSLELAQ